MNAEKAPRYRVVRQRYFFVIQDTEQGGFIVDDVHKHDNHPITFRDYDTALECCNAWNEYDKEMDLASAPSDDNTDSQPFI